MQLFDYCEVEYIFICLLIIWTYSMRYLLDQRMLVLFKFYDSLDGFCKVLIGMPSAL